MSMNVKDLKPTSGIVSQQPQATAENQAAKKSPKVSLFSSSSFSQTPASVTFPDGTSINIPQLTDSDLQQAKSLFGNMSDDQVSAMMTAGSQMAQAYFTAAGTPIPAAVSGSVDLGGADLRVGQAGSSTLAQAPLGSPDMNVDSTQGGQSSGSGSGSQEPALNTRNLSTSSTASPLSGSTASSSQVLGGTIGPNAVVSSPALPQSVNNAASTYQSGYQTAGGKTANYDQTVQAVTFAGVLGLQNQLSDYAKHVQNNINQSNAIQAQAEDINTTLADWPKGPDGKPAATVKFQITSQNTETGSYETTTQALTQVQAKTAYDNLQSTLSTMSSQTQTDQLQLQNIAQNYAQGINTISNLIKMNFDTVKGIIGNIRSG